MQRIETPSQQRINGLTRHVAFLPIFLDNEDLIVIGYARDDHIYFYALLAIFCSPCITNSIHRSATQMLVVHLMLQLILVWSVLYLEQGILSLP